MDHKKIALWIILLMLVATASYEAYYVLSKTKPVPAPLVQNEHLTHASGTTTPITLSEQQEYERKRDEYLQITEQQDPWIALSQLQEEVETNEVLTHHCHSLVHEIGRASYKKYQDIDEALSFENSICNSGYLHGVIEQYFSNVTDIFAAMKTMCSGRDFGRCYHGMGHGLMYYTANDLPESIAYCESLSSGAAAIYCSQGVYMENFNTDLKLHPSKYLKLDDFAYPCQEQKEQFKASCYFYAPTFYLAHNKDNYDGALDWCLTLEEGHRNTCARGVGSLAMKYHINDPKYVESLCGFGTDNQRLQCVDGMIGIYINHYDSLEKGREMCAKLAPRNQRTCYAGVSSRSSLFAE